jgi:isochorismate synthase
MGCQAEGYSVHHLFDAAFIAGWTLVGYRLPGAQRVYWTIPKDPWPAVWSNQRGPGFVLAPFSYPTSHAHWIARDFSFEGVQSLGDRWRDLPDPLRSAMQSIDLTAEADSNPVSTLLKSVYEKDHNAALIQNNPGAQGRRPVPDRVAPHAAALNQVDRTHFEMQVGAALKAIETGRIEKVVLARSEAHAWPSGLHPVDFVGRLCIDYPQAFVNLVLHPEWGLWMGATPELLLEMEPVGDRNIASTGAQPMRHLRSMALAGTLAIQGQTDDWGDKEIREQQVVDDYIAHSWKSQVRNFRRSARNSLQAGPMQHLCTLLEGESDRPLEELVAQLHPTPAVGGWPKSEALQVIAEIEQGSRQLYGGFIGPVESPDEARLFVNLRTLQLRNAQAYLHMGCGILGGSQPYLEWEETVLKSKTLLRHFICQNPMNVSSVDEVE